MRRAAFDGLTPRIYMSSSLDPDSQPPALFLQLHKPLCLSFLHPSALRLDVLPSSSSGGLVLPLLRIGPRTYLCCESAGIVFAAVWAGAGAGSVAVMHYCCRLYGQEGPVLATSLTPSTGLSKYNNR